MLIISKFHDYYDTAIGYGGVDKSIIYKRKTKTIGEKDNIKLFEYFKDFDNIKYQYYNYYIYKIENKIIKYVYILFCGEIYPLLITEDYKFIYSIDDMDEYVNETKDKQYIKKYFNKKNKYRNNINDFFIKNKNVKTKDNLFCMHINLRTPIIIYINNRLNRSLKIILNPNLKKYKFYRMIDSFQTFQKIEQFISGIMGSDKKELIEIEDKYRKAMHGFDEKSFRNM